MSSYHRTAQYRLLTAGLSVLLAGVAATASAQPTTITIQTAQPGKAISPDLFGVFFEDLNYAADGGLYAELIQNRSFEYSPTEQADWHPLKFWELQKRSGGDGTVGVAGMRPIHDRNPHYALLTVRNPGEGVARRNHTQWHPDLIYFTGTDVYPTANYYVQQLFGQNSGDTYSETTIMPAAKPATLAASAVRDSQSGDFIVKIVNGGSAAAALKLQLAGLSAGERRAIKSILTGADADAFNEDGQPPAVEPVVSETTLAPNFNYEAPAHSLIVFRVKP